MSNPSQLRDSTQIVVHREVLREYETQLADEFTVTVFDENDEYCRIIGSPVEIKEASEFLMRCGVNIA
ncbi:VNG_1110C family protein [Halostagnicola bangensis]